MTTRSLDTTLLKTGKRGNLLFVFLQASKRHHQQPFSHFFRFTIHVVDVDPNSCSANGWLEDVSKVEKYQISEEDYNARDNTYRKFKEEKLKEDPTWTLQKEIAKRTGKEYKEPISDEEYLAAEAQSVTVGSRCEVYPGGKRGQVMYVGKVEGIPLGYWVGVQYDEPVGKNDGELCIHESQQLLS